MENFTQLLEFIKTNWEWVAAGSTALVPTVFGVRAGWKVLQEKKDDKQDRNIKKIYEKVEQNCDDITQIQQDMKGLQNQVGVIGSDLKANKEADQDTRELMITMMKDNKEALKSIGADQKEISTQIQNNRQQYMEDRVKDKTELATYFQNKANR